MYSYKTQGVCSQQILFDVDGDTITKVQFIGGCPGNTNGLARMVEGQKIDDVIAKLEGTKCRPTTSCPDQLAQALKAYKEQNK